MAKRPSKRRHHTEDGQDYTMTPVINIVMVIIPFLLLTAVFAKTSIIDLYLPQESEAKSNNSNQKPSKILAIKITDNGFKLEGIGKGLLILKKKGKLDFVRLTNELMKIKKKYPEKQEAILLFSPKTSYGTVIKVMDASRETTDVPRKELFPLVSLGESN